MIIVIEMLEKLYFTINCKIIILEIDFSKIFCTYSFYFIIEIYDLKKFLNEVPQIYS